MVIQTQATLGLRNTGRTEYNKHKKYYDERRRLSAYR
jgi:hypothetical protein